MIVFAASPGTITGVITISAAHTRTQFPLTSLVAIVVATLSTWLVMLLFARIAGNEDGGGLLRDTATRII